MTLSRHKDRPKLKECVACDYLNFIHSSQCFGACQYIPQHLLAPYRPSLVPKLFVRWFENDNPPSVVSISC